jgi:hypothetical protein
MTAELLLVTLKLSLTIDPPPITQKGIGTNSALLCQAKMNPPLLLPPWPTSS